jgi:uncharacterized membrane protein YidH (DUF202 family)
MISIVAIAIVAIAVIWKLRNREYMHRDTDYKAFFWMGLIWVIIGGPVMWLYDQFSMSGLFAMGVIFLAMGLANRDKWDKKRRLSGQEAKWKVVTVIIGVLVLLLGVFVFALFI